jgi:hypothetical protein
MPGLFVQIGKKNIVGDKRPLFVIQSRETFQVGEHIFIKRRVFLSEIAHDFGSPGNGELKVLLFRNGEVFCFCAVLRGKNEFSILMIK